MAAGLALRTVWTLCSSAGATFTFSVPSGGTTYEASFETTLDENGRFAFTTPPFKVSGAPGTYSATIKAEAGELSDTEVISFTVNAPPAP